MREGSKQLRRLGFTAVFAFALSTTCALGQTNPACGVPAALGDGWTIDSPDSVGLDGARLCRIADRLKETEANMHAVVVVRALNQFAAAGAARRRCHPFRVGPATAADPAAAKPPH